MAKILHLDSSPRAERSISRTLTQKFVTTWQEHRSEDEIIYRDLGHMVIPPVNEAWIAAAFSPSDQVTSEMQQSLQWSDELIDEFIAADYYVLGVPMYNFNVPSNFKAYIDQIVRVNRTFKTSALGFEGLVSQRKMVIITARGGSFLPETPMAAFDFQEPFLRAVFGLIGITDLTFIHADNLAAGVEMREQSIAAATAAIQTIIATWS